MSDSDTEKEDEARRSERIKTSTKINFVVDNDVIDATGVDISDSGICFDTEKPLTIRLKYISGGKTHWKKAHLVRASSPQGKPSSYAFKFVDKSLGE